jgi:hypothetical protein
MLNGRLSDGMVNVGHPYRGALEAFTPFGLNKNYSSGPSFNNSPVFANGDALSRIVMAGTPVTATDTVEYEFETLTFASNNRGFVGETNSSLTEYRYMVNNSTSSPVNGGIAILNNNNTLDGVDTKVRYDRVSSGRWHKIKGTISPTGNTITYDGVVIYNKADVNLMASNNQLVVFDIYSHTVNLPFSGFIRSFTRKVNGVTTHNQEDLINNINTNNKVVGYRPNTAEPHIRLRQPNLNFIEFTNLPALSAMSAEIDFVYTGTETTGNRYLLCAVQFGAPFQGFQIYFRLSTNEIVLVITDSSTTIRNATCPLSLLSIGRHTIRASWRGNGGATFADQVFLSIDGVNINLNAPGTALTAQKVTGNVLVGIPNNDIPNHSLYALTADIFSCRIWSGWQVFTGTPFAGFVSSSLNQNNGQLTNIGTSGTQIVVKPLASSTSPQLQATKFPYNLGKRLNGTSEFLQATNDFVAGKLGTMVSNVPIEHEIEFSFSSLTGNGAGLCGKYNSGTGRLGYCIYILLNGAIRVVFDNSTTNRLVVDTPAGSIALNTKYSLKVTYNGNKSPSGIQVFLTSTFVNGVPQYGAPLSLTTVHNTLTANNIDYANTFTIGCIRSNGTPSDFADATFWKNKFTYNGIVVYDNDFNEPLSNIILNSAPNQAWGKPSDFFGPASIQTVYDTNNL